MTGPAPPACPICGKPPEPALRPFCSRRCAEVDLGRWLTAQYVVPGDEAVAPDLGDPALQEPD